MAWQLLPERLNEACVCRLIKGGVKRDDASLPLLCDEKQRESWANRSGFSNFSSLTLIQKQFSAISWGTICNDTRIPLSPQSETAIPPTCHSKSSSHWRWGGLCVCLWTHMSLSLASELHNKQKKRPKNEAAGVRNILSCDDKSHEYGLNDDVWIDPDWTAHIKALVDPSWD